ncbi:hypothetical protein [Fulvivirga sp. M361]|nr:hypothetical protein [Fulvivirga sp. M361]
MELPNYIESDSSGRLKLNFSKGIKSEKGKELLKKVAAFSVELDRSDKE